jgi:alpha-beta hydrolase superfamily lysophospholipase
LLSFAALAALRIVVARRRKEETMTDVFVASAISHWAPRFLANGVTFTDFVEVTGALASWNAWCGAWSARAAIHEGIGRAALAEGKHLSAGEHLQRAGVYYHFAKFLFVHDLAAMRAAHMKAVACRELALPHLSPPGERVAIPYAGGLLHGILRKPLGVARPPVLVMICGLDSCKEETGAYEQPFLARGIAALVFDGPGQGEAEYDLPIRGDYETPVKAVIDYVETRRDLDASRLGLWGVSLGGYYAPRAAAFDKRVKACIALSGPFDLADAWDVLPDLTREAFRVRSHCATQEDARRNAATLSLKGRADRIACPLFVVAGRQDRVIPWQHAERLAREAGGPVELMVIEDGNHVANNRSYRWRLQSADWMAERLA